MNYMKEQEMAKKSERDASKKQKKSDTGRSQRKLSRINEDIPKQFLMQKNRVPKVPIGGRLIDSIEYQERKAQY